MGKRSRKTERFEKQKNKRLALDDQLKTSWSGIEGIGDVDIESIPRSFKEEEDDESLPVISSGKVIRVAKQNPKKSAEVEEEPSDVSSSEDEDAESENLEEIELEVPLKEVQETIAEFAELLNESPEEHVGKLKELQRLLAHSRKGKTRQVLVLSLLALYKDLIPGYHIRPLTDAQAKEKVSKDVRLLRDYEQQFLATYKGFVEILDQLVAQAKGLTEGSKYEVASTAIYASCELLERAPWFNFRTELIKLIVQRLSSQRIDQSFLHCISAVEKSFEEDNEGHVSFEIVQGMAKMIKVRRYKVDSKVLATLLRLRLLTELVGRADLERMIKEKPQDGHIRKKDRVHLTKKERKIRKEQKEIDEEMRKAETAVSAQVREKLQAQTLKIVFVLYFNILKQRSKTLMGATLEGLAQFSRLMNSDLFGDILEVLREIISEQKTINTRESLLCIVTAFSLLSGQAGESMNLDLSFFINELYKVLFALAFDPHIEVSHKHLGSLHKGKLTSETEMLARSLEALFTKRSSASRVRVLAFAKRLAMSALYFPERTSLVSLSILDHMVRKHPFAKALFNTQDRVNKGVYQTDVDIPEQSNAEVAVVWETALLSRHYDPKVARAAKALSNIRE